MNLNVKNKKKMFSKGNLIKIIKYPSIIFWSLMTVFGMFLFFNFNTGDGSAYYNIVDFYYLVAPVLMLILSVIKAKIDISSRGSLPLIMKIDEARTNISILFFLSILLLDLLIPHLFMPDIDKKEIKFNTSIEKMDFYDSRDTIAFNLIVKTKAGDFKHTLTNKFASSKYIDLKRNKENIKINYVFYIKNGINRSGKTESYEIEGANFNVKVKDSFSGNTKKTYVGDRDIRSKIETLDLNKL